MDLFGKKAFIPNEQLKQQLLQAGKTIEVLQQKLNSLGYEEYSQETYAVSSKNAEISEQNQLIARSREVINDLRAEEEKLTKQVRTATNKLGKSRELYKSVECTSATM